MGCASVRRLSRVSSYGGCRHAFTLLLARRVSTSLHGATIAASTDKLRAGLQASGRHAATRTMGLAPSRRWTRVAAKRRDERLIWSSPGRRGYERERAPDGGADPVSPRPSSHRW